MSERPKSRPPARPPFDGALAGLGVPAPPSALRARVLAAALATARRVEAGEEPGQGRDGAAGGQRRALPTLVDRLWTSRTLWLGWAAAVALLAALNAGTGRPAGGGAAAPPTAALESSAAVPRRTLGQEMARFGLPTPRPYPAAAETEPGRAS